MDIDPLPLAQTAIQFVTPPNWVAWSFIVFIALLCIFGSAFFSGSELAYFALRPSQLEKMEDSDNPAKKRVATLMDDSEKFLATILISNNLVNITMVVLLTFAINQVIEFNSDLLNFLIQTVFLTFLLLVFGEIFPKLVARGRPEIWAEKTSGPLTVVARVLSPLASMMAKSSFIINKVVTKKDTHLSPTELEKALEISDLKEGQEREMLEGILSFGEKEASDIMIPRVDVTALEYHDSWEEVMRITVESGFSRIPVYDTSQDTIKGILYAKDLLPYIDNRKIDFEWQGLIREAYFVPEGRMIDDLLEDFRHKKIHIAIVVDEYGGTQGIVTLEDVIEEILGEIDDEYDRAINLYRPLTPGNWIFDAKITIGDFCDVIDIEEEDLGDIGDAETLAGLVLERKGDFPERGEEISMPLEGKSKGKSLRLKVLSIEKHRILKVKVSLS